MLTIALKWITEILKKHDVQFQISGGLAAHIYGAEREVNDIDIDIPEEQMELIVSDIQDFITFGPADYIDEKWNLKLITLNYKGQEIDIGGAYKTKIFDDKSQSWISSPADLNSSEIHTFQGIELPVVEPKSLIAYKSLLNGEHQKSDIEAVKKYCGIVG